MSLAKMRSVVDILHKSNIGYNQHTRWSFYRNGKIIPNTAADCSSICGVIMKRGGYNIDLTGTFYTGNYASKAKAAGFTVLRYKNLDQVRAGDFILQPNGHIEFAYTKKRWYSARIDERGRAFGGKPGNQTGRETGFVNAYVYSKGWTYILRPPSSGSKPPPTSKPSTYAETLRFQKNANTYLYAGLIEDGDNGTVTKAWRKWAGLLQKSLNAFRSSKPKLLVDQNPGRITSNYILDVQRRNGLYPDRYPGPVMVNWMRSHGSKITKRPKNRP